MDRKAFLQSLGKQYAKRIRATGMNLYFHYRDGFTYNEGTKLLLQYLKTKEHKDGEKLLYYKMRQQVQEIRETSSLTPRNRT